jgi:hypothetical protein
MSRRPINRSPSLTRLRDEGFDIEVKDGMLAMHEVPYLTAQLEIKRATIFCPLTLNDDVAQSPDNHQVFFVGETPCHEDGTPMEKIGLNLCQQAFGELAASYHFSSKPVITGKYEDFYHKMTTYAALLGNPARAVDSDVRAEVFKPARPDEDDSPFHYEDTASSRAHINAVSSKLKRQRIDIIGCGGTGSYVMDFAAKTPVQEIHIWDADEFLQHNAFRAPGAASGEELASRQLKVERLADVYGKLRRGIVAHPVAMTGNELNGLEGTEFVFLCIDGPGKEPIVGKLEALCVPFIDVGLGVYVTGDRVGGLVRTTTSTPEKRDHVRAKQRITFTTAAEVNEYDSNVQIAELNAFNAVMAIIKWKKLWGFYHDDGGEHFSVYAIGGNEITNEDDE